jgi:adenine-specific DNA-methyltransferase
MPFLVIPRSLLRGGFINRRSDGSIEIDDVEHTPTVVPGTQWNIKSHDSSVNGALLLRSLIPGRRFPFPKSLYAVEDALQFFIADKPNAIVLDFFSGSGTTAHAVMRLNRQDSGQRQCISITNN